MDGGHSNPAPDSMSSVSNWDIIVPPVNWSNWLEAKGTACRRPHARQGTLRQITGYLMKLIQR